MEAETTAPDIGAQLVNELLRGHARVLFADGPFGRRQHAVSAICKGFLSGNEEHGIRGHRQSRGRIDRALVSHLCFSGPEQRFFITEVDFYIPALQITLDDPLYIQSRIGTDEEAGLAVKHF